MKSWLIPKVLEDGAYSFFIPRSWAVVGLNNLHRNVPCYLFRFPAQIFLQEFFSKEVQISRWYSRIAQSVWSSPMVEISDRVLPISKADMWSLWVGRCMHTLVTCIARPKSDPCQGRYLAKFRSHGTWDIWRVWRDEVDSFPFEFIWTSLFATLWDGEWAFLSLFFLKKIAPLSLANISWILWSFEWEAFVEWTVVLRLWLRGSIAGKSGCQYPEWVTDRPDMFGLANGEFLWDEDL